MRLYRYMSLASILFGASISAQLAYRVNFVINFFSSLLNVVGTLLILFVLTGNGSAIGGWNYYEATVVVGLFTLVQGYISAILQPNLNKISESVWTGAFDFTLLKPVDAQFFMSVRNINLVKVLDMGLGSALIIWAMSNIRDLGLADAALGIALLLVGFLTVYSIWLMLMTTAFWFVKVENITELFNGLFRAAQFPVTAFPGWLRLFFSFVVPIAFITTVPAEAFIGRIQPQSIMLSIAVTLILFVVSRLVWMRALSKYTSASS